MIDFTDMPKKNKSYAGANGSKISVIYNREQYMLKFPSHAAKNQDMSYSNSCISEYLGCKIFEIVGIPVQETMLGTYISKKGGKKMVVACKDFTSPDMFIIDALIGNWDRHNGNWGFLYDTRTDGLEMAPVFDCGSSLYPQADEAMIEKVLENRQEIHHRIFNIPVSAIQYKGKKINYYEFISSLRNEECNRALKRLLPRIDMKRIEELIEETPAISDLQKTFYKTMLSERKKRILDFSYSRLCEM